MTELKHKVKNALDEARILVLGSQVLLGFQFRAFFEPGFDRLPGSSQRLEVVGLFLLLATIGMLFLAASRHRIVERGNDSASFHRFAMGVMRFALLPLAAALGLDLYLAAERIAGSGAGLAAGAATGAVALASFYGGLFHPDRKPPASAEEEKMEKTPLDERVVQVLTELRVVLPGAQAVLGFQLAMILTDPFEKLDQPVKLAHLGALGFIALAIIVLMAPAAYHRLVERGENTERFHTFASRAVLVALALLAPGLSGDLYVVLCRMKLEAVAPIVAGATLAVFYAAWFGAMLVLRRTTPAPARPR